VRMCACVIVCITNVRIVKSITFVCLLLVDFFFGQCHGQYSSAHRI